MKLCILIAGVLLCLSGSCLALRWLSTPGEMLACTGDDVTFHWKYDTQDERVSLILIINAETEKTFSTYYIKNNNSKTSDEYGDRIEFIEYSQESTKFMLKSVTKADSMGYIIKLGGTVEENLANLQVFNRYELPPTLHVNNNPQEFHQPLIPTSEEIPPTVMLSTAQSVPANITISVDGDIVETCTKATVCVHSLPDNNVEAIGFEVDYGVCGVITEELTVQPRTTELSDEITFAGHGAFYASPGYLRVLEKTPLTLFWNHRLSQSLIELCYYQHIVYGAPFEAFLGWDNNEWRRLNMSLHHKGWEFLNQETPCLGGIRTETTNLMNKGEYVYHIYGTNGRDYTSPKTVISVYSAIKDNGAVTGLAVTIVLVLLVVVGIGLYYRFCIRERPNFFGKNKMNNDIKLMSVADTDTTEIQIEEDPYDSLIPNSSLYDELVDDRDRLFIINRNQENRILQFQYDNQKKDREIKEMGKDILKFQRTIEDEEEKYSTMVYDMENQLKEKDIEVARLTKKLKRR